jgi:hypothetical protein
VKTSTDKETRNRMQAIWEPLERRLGRERCAGFMYMGQVGGS